MDKLYLAICDDDAGILSVVSGAIISAFRKHGITAEVELFRRPRDLEEALSPKGFLRIHKGYLVNYKFIRRLENTEAVLTNGERIPLSRRRVQEIRTRYLELMQDGRTVIL
ncbi:MAG: LytTR family transcriptional regulator [Clostridiales bacterium]|nr:LytTR family transcriptional regulator [Clostridiales bacterium]